MIDAVTVGFERSGFAENVLAFDVIALKAAKAAAAVPRATAIAQTTVRRRITGFVASHRNVDVAERPSTAFVFASVISSL